MLGNHATSRSRRARPSRGARPSSFTGTRPHDRARAHRAIAVPDPGQQHQIPSAGHVTGHHGKTAESQPPLPAKPEAPARAGNPPTAAPRLQRRGPATRPRRQRLARQRTARIRPARPPRARHRQDLTASGALRPGRGQRGRAVNRDEAPGLAQGRRYHRMDDHPGRSRRVPAGGRLASGSWPSPGGPAPSRRRGGRHGQNKPDSGQSASGRTQRRRPRRPATRSVTAWTAVD